MGMSASTFETVGAGHMQSTAAMQTGLCGFRVGARVPGALGEIRAQLARERGQRVAGHHHEAVAQPGWRPPRRAHRQRHRVAQPALRRTTKPRLTLFTAPLGYVTQEYVNCA